ncbi:MAG: His/Gly/Thr/Pro-type tRNA ligase C-terminal domain-containing protein, partial [Parahaliea sp.]
VTDRLGAQGTVCAGGRYDGLVEQLGGRPTPAAGFALGMERLVLLLSETGQVAQGEPAADIYVVSAGAAAAREALTCSEALRDALPGLRLLVHAGGGSFKSQLKKADRSGARLALIWGDDEVRDGTCAVKDLREPGGQQTVAVVELPQYLRQALAN